MFYSNVSLLHEQYYRFSDYLERIYMSPSYMAQLVTPRSHFSSWFYSILVVEFDATMGHHVTFEYPKGLVSPEEKKRFLHLCLPDSRSMNRPEIFDSRNINSKKKNGWLGFRFKKGPSVCFKNTSSSSSLFVHGASFFQTEKNSAYDRGARQKCVVLLSFLPIKFFYPLLLPVVLYVGYFYLLSGRKIILEACTYIEATWPKCPKWNEKTLTLELRTSQTKPMFLFCAAHRSDEGTSAWSFMGADSKQRRGHFRRTKHSQLEHLNISLKSFLFRLTALELAPKSILHLWNIMQKTPWGHTPFLASYHKVFFSGLKKRNTMIGSLIYKVPPKYNATCSSSFDKTKHVSKSLLLLKNASCGKSQMRNNKFFISSNKKQNIIISYALLFQKKIGKCCFMNTFIHYPIRCFFKTFSWRFSTSLVLSLEVLSHYVWDLWEIALTESPFLVMSANPMTSCSIILNLIRLISPLEYVADIRPHINSYDKDLEYYQEELGKKKNSGSKVSGVLLGSTDPSLLQRLLWCPNIMVANVQKDLCSSLGLKNREIFSLMHTYHLKPHGINDKFIKSKCLFQKNNLSSLLHSFKKQVSKPNTNMKPENVSTTPLPPSSEFHFFKHSKNTLNKDPILHKKISTFLCKTFPKNLSHSKEKVDKMEIVAEAIALDAEIFSHFEHLTQTLLYAFHEFIQPDLKILMLNPLIKTPKPKAFTPMFLGNLEKVNPALQGLYLAFGRSTTNQLYNRFIQTQTFRRWLSTQIMREQQTTLLLQLKYCAAVKLSSLTPKLTVSTATEGCLTLKHLLHECKLTAPQNQLKSAKALLSYLHQYIQASFTTSLHVIRVSLPEKNQLVSANQVAAFKADRGEMSHGRSNPPPFEKMSPHQKKKTNNVLLPYNSDSVCCSESSACFTDTTFFTANDSS